MIDINGLAEKSGHFFVKKYFTKVLFYVIVIVKEIVRFQNLFL